MCGVIGVVSNSAANQLLYDGLMVLQHRGQDAAGIVTAEESRFHMHKGQGLARDVFRTRDMRSLLGDMGVAHVRYPTAGSASSSAESQPFYVNSPYGIVLGHNGNLTNTHELKESLFRADLRHVNTNSDSEVLLNVLAHELQVRASGRQLNLDTIFGAVAGVHARCKGAYAVTAFIAGYGLLAFRDPHGIRPLVIGVNDQVVPHEYIIASESVAVDTLGFRLLRDVAPGEAIFIDYQRKLHSRLCSDKAVLNPCIFEYVYLARPDSVMDGVSVYNTRLAMGVSLAEKIKREFSHLKIDVVIPIPDLNAIGEEFKGQNVLLVDDSIVRGTTSREIVQMARDAGAAKVYFASASPPVRYSNVYGIDMPTRDELIASGRSGDEIAREIGCDALIYQDLDAMVEVVRAGNPAIPDFDTSCFDGRYVTGDVTPEYLNYVEAVRNGETPPPSALSTQQLDLNLAVNNG